MSESRVVRPSQNGSGWEVASAVHRGSTFSVHPTQTAAISAARSQVTASGGDVRVCGRDGLVRHNIRVDRPSPLPAAPPPSAATPPPPPARREIDPASFVDDAGTVIQSLRSNSRGERLDDDGDGTDDGEAIVTRVLDSGDNSATSLFFRGSGAFITIVLGIVLPLAATFLGIRIQGLDALGASYWTVFVATLAWSGGIAFATFVFRLKPSGWDATGGVLVIGAGFSASSILAAVMGGVTMTPPSALVIPDAYRILIQMPKNRQTLIALLFVVVGFLIWFILLAGLASYGLVGLILGALAGLAIGLQAAHRIRQTLSSRGGGQSP